jgi:hypothetical protein
MSEKDLDLDGIEARLKAISIEPLELETDERQMDDSHYWTAEIKNEKGDTIADIADNYWNYGEFFANAPTDIAALVAEVKRLREGQNNVIGYLEAFHGTDRELIENVTEMLATEQGQYKE